VTKHSEAKKIKVELLHHNNHIHLIVEDNGLGFDTKSKQPTGHFGLIGMKERAELAGGSLTIESEKNKGTKVTLNI
jgi:two-component system sensor histidine kinase DegS